MGVFSLLHMPCVELTPGLNPSVYVYCESGKCGCQKREPGTPQCYSHWNLHRALLLLCNAEGILIRPDLRPCITMGPFFVAENRSQWVIWAVPTLKVWRVKALWGHFAHKGSDSLNGAKPLVWFHFTGQRWDNFLPLLSFSLSQVKAFTHLPYMGKFGYWKLWLGEEVLCNSSCRRRRGLDTTITSFQETLE